MKKIITALVIIMLIAVGSVLRSKYVFIDDKFYPKDVKELFINLDDTSISELNQCAELEFLMASYANNTALEQMNAFENLTDLIIHANTEISGSGIEKINMLPNLKSLWFRASNIDLSNIRNDSVERIEISHCEMTDSDLMGLKNCPSLNCLMFYRITLDNCFTVTSIPRDDRPLYEKRYALTDSSCLSGFDSIKELNIYSTYIEDISGIEEMDSLETLTVDKGYISWKDKKALEAKGITVRYSGES